MIEIKKASFSYENSVGGDSVKNVDLIVPKGQVILLCGESGCGKTTIIRLVNGLIPYYYEGEIQGEIIVKEKNVCDTLLHELAPIVGTVFQNPKSQFYTVETDTEIVFACENLGMQKDEIMQRFERTVSAFRIEGLLGRRLFALSGGEKQKIACASVSALSPDIFVLDEPSSNLDIGAIYELKKIIARWKAEGKTIVIAEHRLYWLLEIADRVLYIKDGVIDADMPMDKFKMIPADKLVKMGLRALDISLQLQEMQFNSGEELELHEFRFSYGKNEVLNFPQIHIPKGAVVAVLGLNGAGKTTFARCLCGLEKKSSGTLKYGNKRYSAKQRIKLCYMVMQDVNHQLFTESVLDEVLLSMKNRDEEERLIAAGDILEKLDLTNYIDAHPMSLSGGEKQRVAIAGALASQKEIIVYDEPTSGLDYRHMLETAENIKQLTSMEKTQFIITHDPELVVACCNFFVFVEGGKITHSGCWNDESRKLAENFFLLSDLSILSKK